MRLLVLSNVSGSVDKIEDILQNHHVIAKEASISESAMANSAAEHLKSGAYDQVIILARDPIQANMLLNKKDGINAAVCSSTDDVKLAKEDGANAIVVRDIDTEEAREIVAQAVGNSPLRGLKMPSIKLPEVKMPQLQQKQQERNTEKHGAIPFRKTKYEEAAHDEEPEHRVTSGNLIDKIKDYLGII